MRSVLPFSLPRPCDFVLADLSYAGGPSLNTSIQEPSGKVSFLFNAVNTIDLCMRIPILAKVIESMTQSQGPDLGLRDVEALGFRTPDTCISL